MDSVSYTVRPRFSWYVSVTEGPVEQLVRRGLMRSEVINSAAPRENRAPVTDEQNAEKNGMSEGVRQGTIGEK
jgi:hypothetical protein